MYMKVLGDFECMFYGTAVESCHPKKPYLWQELRGITNADQLMPTYGINLIINLIYILTVVLIYRHTTRATFFILKIKSIIFS